MTTPTNKQLREFILASFNENELYTFCFDYFEGVEHHFSGGMPMLKKVIELISYCNRHKIRENLLVALQQERGQTYQIEFGSQQKKKTTPSSGYKTQPRNPKQIFVAHSSEDAELAHQIARDLKTNGYDIYITPDSIRPGEKWVPAINRGLEESGIFVVLLTPNAVLSEWVHDETNAAVTLANAYQMRLFMLDVESCDPPILWRQRQFISFRDGDYRRNLVNLLRALAGKVAILPSQNDATNIARTLVDFQSEIREIAFVLDPFGFPMVKLPQVDGYVSWYPVTKVQFEDFLSRTNQIYFDEIWYRKVLSKNPRETAGKLSRQNYWNAFLTGITPAELEDFMMDLGENYSVISFAEWFRAYEVAKQIKAIDIGIFFGNITSIRTRTLIERINSLIPRIVREFRSDDITLADQMLMRYGVGEWVFSPGLKGLWEIAGSPNPSFLRLPAQIDQGRPIRPFQARINEVDFCGIRLFKIAYE